MQKITISSQVNTKNQIGTDQFKIYGLKIDPFGRGTKTKTKQIGSI